MKKIILLTMLFISNYGFSQVYQCNKSIGYSCEKNIFTDTYSRNALCFAYGEEIISVDKEESFKLFLDQDSCESISVTEGHCRIIENMSSKACGEMGGNNLYPATDCLICN